MGTSPRVAGAVRARGREANATHLLAGARARAPLVSKKQPPRGSVRRENRMAGTSPNQSIWSGPGLTAGARGDVALVPPVRRGATATRLQAFVPVVLLALLLGVLYALGTHRLRTGAL